MNTIEQTQPNVMASNAMTPPPSTQVTTANEAAINPKLQRWIDFCEQTANEMGNLGQHNTPPQCTDNSDEIKKARAAKRLDARLRRMEVEQKAIQLAEAHESLAEARRNFDSQPQVPNDYTSGPPSTIEDIFREEKAREELKAMEKERKEELYNEAMEKRAKEAGDDWPRIQEMMADVRFDHIPKLCPRELEIIAKAFPGPKTSNPKEQNE